MVKDLISSRKMFDPERVDYSSGRICVYAYMKSRGMALETVLKLN